MPSVCHQLAPCHVRAHFDFSLQVLYDAFFKHQRKPKMTGLGELYYEGKEYEAQLEHLKPGVLSDELRVALGMSDNSPPPWLVNMQVGPEVLLCSLTGAGMVARRLALFAVSFASSGDGSVLGQVEDM